MKEGALGHRVVHVAPFAVFYMTIFGYVVFGDVPGAPVWIGAAIVVASGLYLFHRERTK